MSSAHDVCSTPTVMCSDSLLVVCAWCIRPPREVQRVAGAHLELTRHGPGLDGVVAERLTAQRQGNGGVVEGPLLGAVHLEHRRVVAVVVHPQPLRLPGRQVDVRLDGAAHLALHIAAQHREERGHEPMELVHHDGPARRELLVQPPTSMAPFGV